jgi:hypothetical protein
LTEGGKKQARMRRGSSIDFMASWFMTAGGPASNTVIYSIAFAKPISSGSFGMPLKRADHGPRTRVGIFRISVPRF